MGGSGASCSQVERSSCPGLTGRRPVQRAEQHLPPGPPLLLQETADRRSRTSVWNRNRKMFCVLFLVIQKHCSRKRERELEMRTSKEKEEVYTGHSAVAVEPCHFGKAPTRNMASLCLIPRLSLWEAGVGEGGPAHVSPRPESSCSCEHPTIPRCHHLLLGGLLSARTCRMLSSFQPLHGPITILELGEGRLAHLYQFRSNLF